MYFLQLLHLKMRWLRRPIHLTNNINPNIYRFLRQRGVLTTIIISYEIRTICFERVSVANWNHSKDATVRSVTSERERNLTKHASTERQRSFVLGRSTTFTNAIPSILLCSYSLTTLHGNLFLKATFNWNVVNKHPIPNYY